MQSLMKEKPYTCDLCGETDDDVLLYIGGYSAYHHEKCGKIGNLAIEKYHRRIATSSRGLEWFVNDFKEIFEEIDKSTFSASLRRDEQC